VTHIAQGKASILAEKYPTSPILTADTTVYRQGRVFGKPKNEKEAFDMLKTLSGQWHSVFTGVTVQLGTKYSTRVEETRVLFNPLTNEQIELYHDKLHLYDKAGSYQLQNAGGIIVNRIDGCYYNVVGFPVNSVRILLHEIGIDLWNCLKD
jgi:septum formation protein